MNINDFNEITINEENEVRVLTPTQFEMIELSCALLEKTNGATKITQSLLKRMAECNKNADLIVLEIDKVEQNIILSAIELAVVYIMHGQTDIKDMEKQDMIINEYSDLYRIIDVQASK